MLIKRTSALIVAISFVFSGYTVFAQAVDPLVAEVQITEGDSTYINSYLYNNNNAKSLEINHVFKNGLWMRREQTEWFYTDGLCTEQHFRKWTNGSWQPVYKIKFGYNERYLISETHIDIQSGVEKYLLESILAYNNGRLDSRTEYEWKNNEKRTNSQTVYSYDKDGLITQINLKIFTDNIETSEQKTELTYNDLLEIRSILISNKVDTEAWENSTLITYYYKPNSTLKSYETVKKWDPKYNKWENEQNIEYTYNASNMLISENYQRWYSMSWINDLRHDYFYNEAGLLTKKTIYLPLFKDFRPTWSIIYSDFMYEKAKLVEAKNEFWGGETGALYNTFIPYQFNNETVVRNGSQIKIRYIATVMTKIDETYLPDQNNYILVYPNPSKGIFYFDTGEYKVDTWIITDLSGKTILSKKENYHTGVIDLGDVKPGIYMFQAFTNDGIKTQKLIKK